jgi:indole-3-glycerol phosphate synthase
MTTVLEKICAEKRAHIETKKREVPLDVLKQAIKSRAPALGFSSRLEAIAQQSTALITEIKKASPSKGIIRADFDPVTIAKTYERSGAACLSILTDAPYFQGHDDYFLAVRAISPLPLLRKDFMLDPYQIYESRSMGADCILLIMAALEDKEARDLFSLSHDLGMEVLVEVHNAAECERALMLAPRMIGINNRNLKTLSVDIQTSFELADSIPDHILKISESGLDDPTALIGLKKAGFSAFLIGESLMKQPDIGQATENFISKSV